MTNTHIMTVGDCNAQVGSNDEPRAIDSKYIGRHALAEQNSRGQWLRHWAVKHQLTLAITLFEKQDYNKATYHSTKQCMQLDYVLLSRAVFRHCRDAEATGQIDMKSDHKAVIRKTNE